MLTPEQIEDLATRWCEDDINMEEFIRLIESKILETTYWEKVHEIPDDAHIMTMQDFIRDCQNKSLRDYDGFGRYSDGVWETKHNVYPSDEAKGLIKDWYSHVVWYNR